MGIRLQPKEIEVPPDDPFKNDLLDRKAPVEALTAIIGSNEGPGVIAVDAGWGMGKTTFIKMLVAHLQLKGFPAVVHFNAWETDFAENPFLALTAEIIDGLGTNLDNQAGLKNAASEVLSRSPGVLLRLLASAVPQVGPQIVKEIETPASPSAEDLTADYKNAKLGYARFREALKDSAKAVSEACKPLVVVIDELDRCRPSYAVELLEVAKHFFSVDRVVFVLALDRSQLAHSVKVLYGEGFAAEGYLGRFFDADLRLPTPDRTKFFKSLLEATGINGYLDKGGKSERFRPGLAVDTLLPLYLDGSDLDLRSVAQVIHRLGIAIASLEASMFRFVPTLVTLLIMRSLAPGPYRNYIDDRATDEETIKALQDTPGGKAVLDSKHGEAVEALILIARLEQNWHLRDPLDERSPRLQQYRDAVTRDPKQGPPDEVDIDIDRARKVMNCVYSMTEPLHQSTPPKALDDDQIGFELCVKRIELLEFDDQSSITQAP